MVPSTCRLCWPIHEEDVSHDNWLEAHIVESATSEATIQKLKATFASHGLPVNLVTDNGSVFTSLKPSASVDLSEVVDRVSASVANLRLKDSYV